MRKYVAIFSILIMWITIGCITHTVTTQPAKSEFGTPIDISKYDQVIEGKSTESNLIALFGQPTNVTERSGIKVYQYYHHQTQTYGSIASPSGSTGSFSQTMVMFKIINGVVVKKAKMVGSQPIDMKPQTVTTTPSK
jgi:hypothetical protein